MLIRHWNSNRSGFCRSPSCSEIPGTLEHLLVTCPALSTVRERLYQMWLEKSVMFPVLHATILSVLSSDAPTIVQFILEPLAFPIIFQQFLKFGDQFIQQLSQSTRTFAFYMDKHYKKLTKEFNNPTPPNIYDFTDSANSILFPALTTRCEDDTTSFQTSNTYLSPYRTRLPLLLQPMPSCPIPSTSNNAYHTPGFGVC